MVSSPRLVWWGRGGRGQPSGGGAKMLPDIREVKLFRGAAFAVVLAGAVLGGPSVAAAAVAPETSMGAVRDADGPGAVPGSYIVVLKQGAKPGTSRAFTAA